MLKRDSFVNSMFAFLAAFAGLCAIGLPTIVVGHSGGGMGSAEGDCHVFTKEDPKEVCLVVVNGKVNPEDTNCDRPLPDNAELIQKETRLVLQKEESGHILAGIGALDEGVISGKKESIARWKRLDLVKKPSQECLDSLPHTVAVEVDVTGEIRIDATEITFPGDFSSASGELTMVIHGFTDLGLNDKKKVKLEVSGTVTKDPSTLEDIADGETVETVSEFDKENKEKEKSKDKRKPLITNRVIQDRKNIDVGGMNFMFNKVSYATYNGDVHPKKAKAPRGEGEGKGIEIKCEITVNKLVLEDVSEGIGN